MHWFKHQTNSLDSPFIQLLLDKFEAQGYLAFFGLRETIAKEVGNDPLKKVSFSPSFLRRKFRISSSKLEQIFRFCVTNGELLGNFSEEKWEFQDCKLLELKDNYTKDLQATGKKLAHHKEVEEDKEKIKIKNKKEDKELKPIVGIHQEIVTDLNIVLGTNYRSTTKGIQKLINARLADKQTVEDFKTVHRNMFAAWNKDPKMREFLRPDTLYTEKFQGYLNKRPPTLSQQGIVSEKTEKTIEVMNRWLANEEAKDREAGNVE